jgi:hypothetical protein
MNKGKSAVLNSIVTGFSQQPSVYMAFKFLRNHCTVFLEMPQIEKLQPVADQYGTDICKKENQEIDFHWQVYRIRLSKRTFNHILRG